MAQFSKVTHQTKHPLALLLPRVPQHDLPLTLSSAAGKDVTPQTSPNTSSHSIATTKIKTPPSELAEGDLEAEKNVREDENDLYDSPEIYEPSGTAATLPKHRKTLLQ